MKKQKRQLFLGSLITLGIVYGDIGTSPLYVMKALLADLGSPKYLTREYLIGCLSLVFWTLMLMTTIKYVLIALKADNHGEGGIFALYALVRHQKKWLIVPALIGGAALLADGTLTPAVTVTSAIEGLKGVAFGKNVPIASQNSVIIVTFVILLVLFLIQRFGTSLIGKGFGPVMFIWFSFLAIVGLINLASDPGMLAALSPHYGLKLLFSPENKVGIFILGSVFLATTGAEALYSDMGHVGKRNIYLTWPFVCTALVLNYFGQGAYLSTHLAQIKAQTNFENPFYAVLGPDWYLFGVVLATLAAIIASQALITGSFTLVQEAVGLKLLPRMKVEYPSLSRGQIYISAVNWLLCLTTTIVLFYFKTSEHMEAAYGLAITLTMLMTTLLLFEYLRFKEKPLSAVLVLSCFSVIELIFLAASLSKFIHGGYVTVFITLLILGLMFVWFFGNRLRERYADRSEMINLKDYKSMLQALAKDESEPLFTDNLIVLAKVKRDLSVKRELLYSILDKKPKRAKVYWFVTVNTTDEPYTNYYTVDMLGTRNIVNLQLYLGYKMNPSVNLYLYQIVSDLMQKDVIDEQPQKYTTAPGRIVGNFSVLAIQEVLSPDTRIPAWMRLLISARIFIQNHSTTPVQWFGLETSEVHLEKVPLFLKKRSVPVIEQRVILNPKDIKRSTCE
ncbi:KUP/HAK/KT family potassium transporter [Ligilactobacillus animalis]|uniref:KUP/HAK/KT family potassium transporter n=1 Tax=Ligilactobacillus animalis TaxID=1605 RepID=UPI001C118C3D|nr:KUP/HAK/KT family potassium transporter [Ligilactobacillus animalis]MBU5278818.1 KUP/HAK/KT family potassium transporter [Ligilactobacillus animalis]